LVKGLIVPKVTDAFPEVVGVTTMLLKVLSSTVHENPTVVYVDTGAVTQGAAHAGNPMNGIVISAAATPIPDESLRIVASYNVSLGVNGGLSVGPRRSRR